MLQSIIDGSGISGGIIFAISLLVVFILNDFSFLDNFQIIILISIISSIIITIDPIKFFVSSIIFEVLSLLHNEDNLIEENKSKIYIDRKLDEKLFSKSEINQYMNPSVAKFYYILGLIFLNLTILTYEFTISSLNIYDRSLISDQSFQRNLFRPFHIFILIIFLSSLYINKNKILEIFIMKKKNHNTFSIKIGKKAINIIQITLFMIVFVSILIYESKAEDFFYFYVILIILVILISIATLLRNIVREFLELVQYYPYFIVYYKYNNIKNSNLEWISSIPSRTK